MEFFRNDSFSLQGKGDHVYITAVAPGFPIKEFDLLLKQHPRLQMTSFAGLRDALLQATGAPVQIGVLRPLLEITVSRDWMEATLKLNMTESELQLRRTSLVDEVAEALKQHEITEGILFDALRDPPVQRSIVIARGIEPEPGRDAVLSYYSLSERRPTLRQDGSADYYELSFIDEVQPGEWLGEKIPPTDGKDGRNLKGDLLPASKGMDQPLQYDKQFITEEWEDDRFVLRSQVIGSVYKVGKLITVEELLLIQGDVGPQTGNLDYDGAIQIMGTVLDGYSVKATKDISILGESGIGAVGQIFSESGDIYIKGGCFGKERASLRAARHVYIKHAKDCSIEAGESIHIGLYAIGCQLKARHIVLDKKRGKLIGGHVHATVQLTTAYIGNEFERPTRVEVEGFDRSDIIRQLDQVLAEYKRLLQELEHCRREIVMYEGYLDLLSDTQQEEFAGYKEKYEATASALLELEEQRVKLMAYMSARGDGEVAVFQKAYPRTMLQIKELEKTILSSTGGFFYVDKNKFVQE
ncbi:FapA family protein [Paenibacillus filicis]|uniref:FapA family protein n=1 Tax=Paenibacillus filicis TaxID=669464 RepID=A0ABU9DJF1_9BACL